MAVKKVAKKGVVTKIITPAIVRRIQKVNTGHLVYVSPRNNNWIVRKDGAIKATHVYRQKVSAVNAAKRMANDSQEINQVIVYNLQGEISKIIK